MCEDRINELACVVVDELHMVQDRSRGSTVELMLTKLMHAAAGARGDDAGSSPSKHDGDEEEDDDDARADLASPLSGASSERNAAAHPPMQVIGMSATLPNRTRSPGGSGTRRCLRRTFDPCHFVRTSWSAASRTRCQRGYVHL